MSSVIPLLLPLRPYSLHFLTISLPHSLFLQFLSTLTQLNTGFANTIRLTKIAQFKRLLLEAETEAERALKDVSLLAMDALASRVLQNLRRMQDFVVSYAESIEDSPKTWSLLEKLNYGLESFGLCTL